MIKDARLQIQAQGLFKRDRDRRQGQGRQDVREDKGSVETRGSGETRGHRIQRFQGGKGTKAVRGDRGVRGDRVLGS